MTLVHIPFVLGQSERLDTKIAPLGLLKTLENGRIDRDGRIIKRPGFTVGSLTHSDGTTIGTVQTVASRGDERVLVGDNAVNAWIPTLSRWRAWNPLPRVGVPERHAGLRNSDGNLRAPSAAYANGYACVIAEGQNIGGFTSIRALIYDVSTWAVRSEETLAQTSAIAPRVIACGPTLVAIWFRTGTNNIEYATFDLSTPGAVWVLGGASLAVNASLFFDASPYDGTTFLLSWADNVAVLVRGAQFNTAGAALATVSFAFTGTGANAITGTAGEGASIAWFNAAGALQVRSWQFGAGNPFGGAATGPTNVDTNAANLGFPLICRKNSTVHTVGWAVQDTPPPGGLGDETRFREVTTASHAMGTTMQRSYVRPVSKAAYISGRLYFLGVTLSTYDRTLFLLGHTAYGAPESGNDETIETTLARGAARDFDNGRGYSALSTYVDADGNTQMLFSIPFLQAGSVLSSSPFVAIDIVTIPFGGTERLQSAQYGGLLYLSGGLLSVFDGEGAHELGFLAAPKISALSGQTGAGALTTLSQYRYLMTVETYDAMGGHHVSQVSDVATITLTGTQNQVRVDYYNGLLSNRRRMWQEASPLSQLIRTRLFFWRTAANGTLFQRITSDQGFDGYPNPNPAGNFFVDQMSDATLTATSNPFVYTQGQRGALSGPLQHEPPPPCKYLAFGKARAIVGGLEQPDEVRFSKFFFPGEPVEFSEDFAFRRRVQGKVTAVAYLDDAAIVWTKDQIFAVFGEGPDDSGAGSFADPVVLPSEAGCIDWRSVVLTPLGLFFQGRSDRIYLLPRGLGSPVWIGEPVRDTLAANPKVTGAALQAEKGLVVFMCCNPAANTSRSLVFDLRSQQWSVDKLGDGTVFSGNAARLAVWSGALVYAADGGYYVEGATYSDAGVWYGVTIETQALRPHGLQADGRTRKLAVLGEARALLQDVDLAIAPDDAQAFTAGPLFSVSVAGTGDPFRVEWRLPTQKFGSVRVRIRERQNGASLNEAFRFNGLTLDTHARPGMPRLQESRRG